MIALRPDGCKCFRRPDVPGSCRVAAVRRRRRAAAGQQIYFQGARPETAGDVEIFVIDAGDGGLTRLTYAPDIDSAPVAR